MFEITSYSSNLEKGETEVVKLYEQIVVKNFQILKSILPKMNSLYQFNQQLERSVSRMQNRLIKMEDDHENLHYEMRTSHLAIDSKLNGIIEEYTRLSNQTIKFKKQAQFLTKEIRQAKSRQRYQQQQRKIRQSQLLQSQQRYEEQIDAKAQNQAYQQQKKKAIGQNQEEEGPTTPISKQQKYVEFSNMKSMSVEDEQDEVVQSPKVHFNLVAKPKAESIQADSEHNTEVLGVGDSAGNSRKTNLLKGNKLVGRSQKIIKQTKVSEVDEHNKKLDKLLKQIENYHFNNEKMKKNYEELIQQYEKANQLNFAQLAERITVLNNKFSSFDPSTVSIDKISTQLSSQLQEITKSYSILQKELSNKIDKSSFERIMNDFNIRFFGIHQSRKNLANRDQTKKALEFLEKKVNSMLTQYYEVKRKSLHHVSVDKKGCLRVQIYDKKADRQSNRECKADPSPPQTVRKDQTYRAKRQGQSMHARITNGTWTEDRFNENKWRPICTQKIDQLSQTSKRKPDNSSNLSLLKKKSYQILQKDKVRVKPKLKKERLIFQYD